MSKQHWTELLPIDHFTVFSQNVLSEFDWRIITTLYQPLIGSGALSLYMTLWNELDKQKMWGEEMTHYSLMVNMGTPLKDIYQNRRKLEAIGLLNTYALDGDESRKFIYELIPPLSPERFFDDTILAVFLFRQLGSTKYIELRNSFLSSKLDTTNYNQITCSFHDVFESISPSEMERTDIVLHNDEEIFFSDKLEKNIHIQEDTFEFELFVEGLSESIIPKKSITNKVKETVIRLAFLYGMDHIEMKNIIMGAILPDDSIDIEAMRKLARDRYQFLNGNQLPMIAERTQPKKYQMEKEPLSEKDKFIKQLESLSPREWLTALSGGTEPSSADMRMIEDIMFNQKLPAGVMNVLIDYVMKKNDFQLNRNYIEKIASLWARKQLKTVAQAIDYAIEEDRRLKEIANNPSKKNQPYKKKSVTRTEMVPEWLANNAPVQAVEHVDNSSDKRKQLEERLKKYKK